MHWLSVLIITLATFTILAYIIVFVVLLIKPAEILNDIDYVMLRDKIIQKSDSLAGCVDGAAVISLREVDDARRQCVIDDARGLGMHVEAFVVERSPKGGVHGCFDSHQRLARKALKNNLQTFCVFEDDARLTAAVPQGMKEEIQSALSSPDAVIVSLGYLINPILKMNNYKNFKHIYSVDNPFNITALSHTHAYCMNRAAMKVVAGLENTGKVHFDRKIYNDGLPIRILISNPVLFTQCDCDYSSTVTFNLGHKTLQHVSQARVLHLCNQLSRRAELGYVFLVAIFVLITACIFRKNSVREK
jgi:GR25 family glycosyltransferase involved in LPS biosynthesis